MAETYVSALKGVLSGLQGNCRSDNPENNRKCRRAMEEQMVISEIALSTDAKSQSWREAELAKTSLCFDNCRVTGRLLVRECNTLCSSSLIQNLWGRISIVEFEKIAAKYA